MAGRRHSHEVSVLQLLPYDDDAQAKLTPSAVVDRLNRFIVGQVRTSDGSVRAHTVTSNSFCLGPIMQDEAKKAVAVAFRNRWRRHRVQPDTLKEEIQPKNILMIGPTGW